MADRRMARRKAVFGMLMALSYSCIMSAAFALLAHGLNHEALMAWLRGWGVAFLIAVPIGIVLRPLVEKLTGHIVPDQRSPR